MKKLTVFIHREDFAFKPKTNLTQYSTEVFHPEMRSKMRTFKTNVINTD
jgi:hypothetical protein